MGGIKRLTNHRLLKKNMITVRHWTQKLLKQRLKFYEERSIYDSMMISLISYELKRREKTTDRKKMNIKKKKVKK